MELRDDAALSLSRLGRQQHTLPGERAPLKAAGVISLDAHVHNSKLRCWPHSKPTHELQGIVDSPFHRMSVASTKAVLYVDQQGRTAKGK